MRVVPVLRDGDEQLRRFVVRIETLAGCGTGVLIAPGWVLTCAHVVEGLNKYVWCPTGMPGLAGA